MDLELSEDLRDALGVAAIHSVRIGGGSINEAYGVELADGSEVFVKTNRHAQPDMFAAEAQGLAWLAEAKSLRVPQVLFHTPADAPRPHFIVLEMLHSAGKTQDFDEQLGRGLADLHRLGTGAFGLPYDNYIGSLPQPNKTHVTWAEFYRDERILPQVERASSAGLLSTRFQSQVDRLFARLTERVGPVEPPARLHGDLWSGNLHVDDTGSPALIDPAVYGGHREMDLAMMRLFGGFSRRTFEAYEEAYPTAPDAQERIPLYQLYPLLVHVNLFGAGYVGSAQEALRRCL